MKTDKKQREVLATHFSQPTMVNPNIGLGGGAIFRDTPKLEVVSKLPSPPLTVNPNLKKSKGFKKYDSSYKRKESPFTRVGGMGISNIPSQNLIDDQKDRSVLPPPKRKDKKNKRGPFKSKELLNEVSSQLKAASKKHAGQAAKIDKATSAMKLATINKLPPHPIVTGKLHLEVL